MTRGGNAAGDEVNVTEQPAAENAAWAKVDIPLTPRDAFVLLSDIERLFRLNPHLDISVWHEEPGPRRCCRLNALNETNGCRYEVGMLVDVIGANQGIRLIYDSGLKASTELRIDPAGGGSSLTLTEHYHPVKDQDDERLKQVDRSLVSWLAAIRGHVSGLARHGWLPGYRWWVGRFMLAMPPRQRRIVRMIVWVSLLEFIVFLFVVAIFWLRQRSG